MVANPYLSCEFHLKHFLDLIPIMFLEVVTTYRDASDFIRNTNFLENHIAPLFSPKTRLEVSTLPTNYSKL